MAVLAELEKKWKSDKRVTPAIAEEIFRQVKMEIRKSYEKKLKELQDKSTNAKELDEKMALAGKMDELVSWKDEILG